MKKLLLISAAVFSVVSLNAVSHSALAADMPLKYKAPPAPVDPWSGWYAGLNVGGAIQRNCNNLTPEGFLPFSPVDAAFISGLDNGCSSAAGIIGGGQFGANRRFGNLVFGFEADIDALSTNTTRNSAAVSPTTGASYVATHSASVDWLLTARPRAGMLVTDNTLVYVTGGFAAARVNASGTDVGNNGFAGSGAVSQWTPGWTVGGGVETRLGGGPWSLKAEYLYVNLRSVGYDVTQPQSNVGTGFDNNVYNIAAASELHIGRVGLNYKFGSDRDGDRLYDSAAPVVYDWTGAYAGVHIGGAWGHTVSKEPNQELVPGAGPWLAFGDTIDAQSSGVVGGVQAGYNVQMNSIVAGLEGDFGYLGFQGQAPSTLFSGTFVNSEGGAYGTIRGRLGVAWDRFLVYGTGGWMIADVGANVTNPTIQTLGDGLIFTGRTGAQNGWTAGAGVEWAMSHGWSVKGEYLHFDLGSARVIGQGENFLPPNLYAFDIKTSGDIVRLGVNKHFNFN